MGPLYSQGGLISLYRYAARLLEPGIAKEVLKHPRCDPNLPNKVVKKGPLHTAVEKGSVPLVRLLVDCGADLGFVAQ